MCQNHPAQWAQQKARAKRACGGDVVKLLPKDQWAVSVQGGSILLSAWVNGPKEDIRHWVSFAPLHPADDRVCLDDLEGVFVDVVNGFAS